MWARLGSICVKVAWWLILKAPVVIAVVLSGGLTVAFQLSADVFMLLFMLSTLLLELLKASMERHFKDEVLLRATTIMDRDRLFDYLVEKMVNDDGIPKSEARRLVKELEEEVSRKKKG